MSEEAAFRALGEYAVAQGTMTSAQLEAGLASDHAEPADAPQPVAPGAPSRDAHGRFAVPQPGNSREAQAVELMASEMVKRGVVSADQASQWLRSDLAELQGEEPSGGLEPGAVGEARHDEAMRARVRELVRAGEMTPEQGQRALAIYGEVVHESDLISELAAPTSKSAGPLSASGEPNPWEHVELPEGFGPPAKADDYRFDLVVAQDLTTDQLRNLAETMHAARLPTAIATQVITEIASIAAREKAVRELDDKKVSPAAREARIQRDRALMHQTTLAALDRLWGPQDREARIGRANAFLRELDKVRPGVRELLNRSGAGNSLIVVRQICDHVERISAARQGRLRSGSSSR